MSDSLKSTTKAIHRPRRTALVVFALVKNTIHRVGRVLGATTTFARVAEVPFATASHVLRAALALALLAMAIQVAWIARHLSSPARPGSPAAGRWRHRAILERHDRGRGADADQAGLVARRGNHRTRFIPSAG